MKTRLAVLVLAVMTSLSTANAQEKKDVPKTALEGFIGGSGTLLAKGYTDVGTIRSKGYINVNAISFTNIKTQAKASGVSIHVNSGRNMYSRDSISFIDYDELKSLIDGIDYLLSINQSITEHPFFEVSYWTKSGLRINVFNEGTGAHSVQVSTGGIGSETAFLSLNELRQLRDMIAFARLAVDDPKAAQTSLQRKRKEEADRREQERAARDKAWSGQHQNPPTRRVPSEQKKGKEPGLPTKLN